MAWTSRWPPSTLASRMARYLHDVELGYLLRRMEDKGLVVTAVLDCCHSGGATRGGRSRVRGIEVIDRTVRNIDSLVGSPKDLIAAWQATMGGTRGLTLATRPPGRRGHVLLAACRPSELAHEYDLEDGKGSGALTHCLLEELEQSGPGQTWKALYDRILARVHGSFPYQTPLLQGEASRVVFGTDQGLLRFATLVMEVDPVGKRVRLQAGQATGVAKGAHFVIYPHGWTDLEAREKRTALVKVTDRGATNSWAEVIETYPGNPVQSGDQAVLLGTGDLKLVRRVRLMRADGSLATEADSALQAVGKEITGKGWVELVGEGQQDYLVSVTEDANTYEICDPSGKQLPNLRPALRVSDPGSARAVAQRLVHLARFRAVQELENHALMSRMRGKLQVELVGWQKEYERGDKPDPRPFPEVSSVPILRVGEWAFLRIKNVSTKLGEVLNVAALNLEPTWRIAQVFPFDDENIYSEPLDPGQEVRPWLALRASLPDGYDEVIDNLKIFATLGVANVRTPELPQLDQPLSTRTRSVRSPASALDRLFSPVAVDRPKTRNLEPGISPSEQWTTVSVRLRITQ